jgi:hypothetical protein
MYFIETDIKKGQNNLTFSNLPIGFEDYAGACVLVAALKSIPVNTDCGSGEIA